MSNTENQNNKNPDPEMAEFYHDQGWMPDKYYYQLNSKSAHENYADQKRKWQKRLMAMMDGTSNDVSDVHITSEVKIKK